MRLIKQYWKTKKYSEYQFVINIHLLTFDVMKINHKVYSKFAENSFSRSYNAMKQISKKLNYDEKLK